MQLHTYFLTRAFMLLPSLFVEAVTWWIAIGLEKPKQSIQQYGYSNVC